mgnify:CR=1 FL=1
MRVWSVLFLVICLATPLFAAELKQLPVQPAPKLSLRTLDKGSVDLNQLRGNVVLVNFWAVWCPPCRKELPSMNRLMGVNEGESPDEIRAFLTQIPVNFPILLDSEGAFLKPWKVFAFPTSYVIDKQGRLRLGLFGSIEWDSPEAVAQLELLLAEHD